MSYSCAVQEQVSQAVLSIRTRTAVQNLPQLLGQGYTAIGQYLGELGANVQVYSWGDTYTAIATGAVDCLTTVVSASYLVKHTELLKYFTNVKEYYQIVLPVISKKTWDKLNAKQKEILVQAANEAGKEYMRISAQDDAVHIRKAKEEHGLTIINPPMDPWFKKAEAVHAKLEAGGVLPKGVVAAAKAIK